ncbi:hypothetical protein EON79_04265 [bacterium]|nr:MAG: hypothetical protein EON79_04265 [bacterium]
MDSVETRPFRYDPTELWRYYLASYYKGWISIVSLAGIVGQIWFFLWLDSPYPWPICAAICMTFLFLPFFRAKDAWKKVKGDEFCRRGFVYRFTPTTLEYENDDEMRVRVTYRELESVRLTPEWVIIAYSNRRGSLRIPRSAFASADEMGQAIAWTQAGIT